MSVTDQLKHPATIIAGINTAVTAATLYYVYQQISGLRETVAKLEGQLSGLKLTVETIKEQDKKKAEIVRDTNAKINDVSAQASSEMEALSSYLNAMNTDLHGLTEQLNSSGIQVELISVSSARATYQGEMQFPSHYPPQFNRDPAHGTESRAIPAVAHSAAPQASVSHNRQPLHGQGQGQIPAQGQMPSNLPMPSMAKMPFNRAPAHYHPNQHQHQPPQMQMRAGGRPGAPQPPPKVKEPDPIGDLVDLAQNSVAP